MASNKLNILKDQQQRKALNLWYKNNCTGTLELCTSFGKTRTALLAAEWVIRSVENPRILVITPTQVIRDDTWRDECQKWGLIDYYDDGTIETVCIQTAYEWSGNKYDLVILDEAHNYISTDENFDPKYEEFFLFNSWDKLLGLTASIPENKRLGFEKICPVVYQMDLIQAVNLGLVAPFRIINIPVKLTDDERINYEKLSRIIKLLPESRKRNCKEASARRQIVNTAKNKLKLAKFLIDEEHSSEQFITFGENIETAYQLYKSGHDRSRYYSSVSKTLKDKYDDINLTKKQRDISLQQFFEGETRGMCSARALNEGMNVPKVGVAVIVSRTSSDKDIIQRIGRVVRLSDDPNKVATIYNLYCENTCDEWWLNNSLSWIDENSKFKPEVIEYNI